MTLLRRWGSLLAAVVLALGVLSLTVEPAHAAGEDQIDSFVGDYRLQPSGVLTVRETIVWRFGDESGRHGIQRDLVTREKYSETEDAVYDVTNLRVTSPDRVSTQVSTSTTEDDGGRGAFLNVRIGDPDRTISRATATYVLSYDVAGAVRSFDGYDELSWDAPGFGNPAIADLSVEATVPGGAEDTTCFYGPAGSTTECPTDRTRGGSGGLRRHRSSRPPESVVRGEDQARPGGGQPTAAGAGRVEAQPPGAGDRPRRRSPRRRVARRLSVARRAVVAAERA